MKRNDCQESLVLLAWALLFDAMPSSFLFYSCTLLCPICFPRLPRRRRGCRTPSWYSFGDALEFQIISLVLISVTLTVLYIILSIKLIKEEREEKRQKAAAKEEESKESPVAEEVQSSDSEKTMRKRKHASCD